MWRNVVIAVGYGALSALACYMSQSQLVALYKVRPIPGGVWGSLAFGAVIGWLWLWASGNLPWSREPEEPERAEEHQDYWDKQ